MSAKQRIDWGRLQTGFATGAPVLAIGPGCHRIGYAATDEWQRVVARAGLVWRQLGELGASDEEVGARREFLVRYWAGQIGIDKRCVGKVALPEGLEICDIEAAVPRRERARIALATDLLCALAAATRLLGTAITSGAVPVTDWQRFGATADGGPDGPAELRTMTVEWLQRATRIAADLEALQFDSEEPQALSGLSERGLDADDAAEDTLPLLKARSIHVGLQDLLRQRFDAADAEFSGAIVEWLSDLLWHVLVSGAGVPPSQDELSFFLNLQANDDDASRRFSRPHPGEYRGPEDGGETLRSDLGALLADYDSGLDARPRNWGRLRESFSLTMAASLLEITERVRGEGRYAVALVSDFDLMLERALFELMSDGEAFHVIAPAVVSPAPDARRASFRWLFGTVRKGVDGPGGSIESPQWQWLQRVGTADAELPQGPVLLRLTGSPLFEMGTVEELGLRTDFAPDVRELTAAAVFSEHDSVRAVMELTRLIPVGGQGDELLIHRLFGPAGLTWTRRGWLFFGHRFSDWLPRLQLLVTALMLSDESRTYAPQQQEWRPRGKEEPVQSHGGSGMPRVAVARDFDWPEQALLSALEIEMRSEADLAEVSRYYRMKSAHTASALRANRTTAEFLDGVRRRVGLLRSTEPPSEEPPEGAAVGAVPPAPTPGGRAGAAPPSPAVFVSYSQEGEPLESDWNRSVKRFADALSRSGIEVQLDQYGNPLGRDWNTWGPAAVEAAEIVVCLASPGYAEKWRDSFGSGVANEARTIRRALENGELKGVLFVVLPGRTTEDIPNDMRGIHHTAVERIDEAGVEGIVRLLTDQPERVRPVVPPAPRLDPIP